MHLNGIACAFTGAGKQHEYTLRQTGDSFKMERIFFLERILAAEL